MSHESILGLFIPFDLNSCVQVLEYLFPIILGIKLGIKLLNHKNNYLFNILRHSQGIFQNHCTIFHSPRKVWAGKFLRVPSTCCSSFCLLDYSVASWFPGWQGVESLLMCKWLYLYLLCMFMCGDVDILVALHTRRGWRITLSVSLHLQPCFIHCALQTGWLVRFRGFPASTWHLDRGQLGLQCPRPSFMSPVDVIAGPCTCTASAWLLSHRFGPCFALYFILKKVFKFFHSSSYLYLIFYYVNTFFLVLVCFLPLLSFSPLLSPLYILLFNLASFFFSLILLYLISLLFIPDNFIIFQHHNFLSAFFSMTIGEW